VKPELLVGLLAVWAGCDGGSKSPPSSMPGPTAPGAAGSCSNPAPIVDPNTFQECAPGGRCVPAQIVMATAPQSVAQLGPCTQVQGGLCVPENAVRYGANYKPTACQLAGTLEGRCLPLFLPPVQAQAAMLSALGSSPNCQQGVELCVPCYNPTMGNAPTGACTLTACDRPTNLPPAPGGPGGITDAFPPCVQGRGACIPPQLIAAQRPGQSLQNLAQRDCENGGLCVPLGVLANAYARCSGILGILVNRGTCLDTEVLEGVPSVPSRQCQANTSCVPCEVLLLGPTGAPGCRELYGI
jgi:hypothetical protein